MTTFLENNRKPFEYTKTETLDDSDDDDKYMKSNSRFLSENLSKNSNSYFELIVNFLLKIFYSIKSLYLHLFNKHEVSIQYMFYLSVFIYLVEHYICLHSVIYFNFRNYLQ
jgi:hypothetical protein